MNDKELTSISEAVEYFSACAIAARTIPTPIDKYSNDDLLKCNQEDIDRKLKYYESIPVTICNGIKQQKGGIFNLSSLLSVLTNPTNKKINKLSRKVIYSTSDGTRPVGERAFQVWNGFQVIDMDIKSHDISVDLKEHLFERLKKFNWFIGVTLSSSGNGLHIYTKIKPHDDKNIDRKLMYFTNFKHKFSLVYVACLGYLKKNNIDKDELLKWMDLAMFKPQQGAFIGYDEHPLFSTNFREDYIYINFDKNTIKDNEHDILEWCTYPDLKEIFARWEWFASDKGDEGDEYVQVLDKTSPLEGNHVKVHYKHFERWRLANTLVSLYGYDEGLQRLIAICDKTPIKELKGDCGTSIRHSKSINLWAIRQLNRVHGYTIKIKADVPEVNEEALLGSAKYINNPNSIVEAKYTHHITIKSDQHLSDVKDEIFDKIGYVTLLEAGAGVGKTEMVKQLAREGHKCLLVMPFTSTIKSKVENDPDWDYSYGNKRVDLTGEKSIAMTIDKFSRLNNMDIIMNDYEYVFIDESHLMFQSEYRPVMSVTLKLVRSLEIPVILMSGTPSGETMFFDELVHIIVKKETDPREKEFQVMMVNDSSHLLYHMCRQMAKDVAEGRRVLFPTNQGSLYAERVKAGVKFFLKKDHYYFNDINVNYYKKSNLGEDFMDSINFEKTIADTQILMCSNYLSVGVDILDKFEFQIYFADLMMPQEVEQFANRLRNNDLHIKQFVAKADRDGNPNYIDSFRPLDMSLDPKEVRNAHGVLQLCNASVERNFNAYRYNNLVASMLINNKFIEYDDIINTYFLNDLTYKLVYFERRYRDYVQQLPVLMRGMMEYGYKVSTFDCGPFVCDEVVFNDLKNMVKLASDERNDYNTNCIKELIGIITEERLDLYRDVLAGHWEIRKSNKWEEDVRDNIMYVRNIEVFEKVVPIFVSMSKYYPIESIREIFEYCKSSGGRYNFAAINRLKLLTNLIYNSKRDRLDLPVVKFMDAAYEFCKRGKMAKGEIKEWVRERALEYARSESSKDIPIDKAELTIETLVKSLDNMFKCLVNISKTDEKGLVECKPVEMLWKTRDDFDATDCKAYIISEFLDACSDDLGIENTDEPIVIEMQHWNPESLEEYINKEPEEELVEEVKKEPKEHKERPSFISKLRDDKPVDLVKLIKEPSGGL